MREMKGAKMQLQKAGKRPRTHALIVSESKSMPWPAGHYRADGTDKRGDRQGRAGNMAQLVEHLNRAARSASRSIAALGGVVANEACADQVFSLIVGFRASRRHCAALAPGDFDTSLWQLFREQLLIWR
jgi:hypothetical protein